MKNILLFFKYDSFTADNLEVTGVSRSGRVRKKSSKLLDFQSPDNIESRAKRSTSVKTTTTTTPTTTNANNKAVPLPPQISSPNLAQQMQPPPPNIKIEQSSDVPSAMDVDLDEDEDVLIDGHGEIDDSIDDSDDMDEPTLQIDTTVRKSAYMTEKSSKKKMFKDGKVGN